MFALRPEGTVPFMKVHLMVQAQTNTETVHIKDYDMKTPRVKSLKVFFCASSV